MTTEQKDNVILTLLGIIIVALIACFVVLIMLRQNQATLEVQGDGGYYILYDAQTGPHIIRYDTASRTLKP